MELSRRTAECGSTYGQSSLAPQQKAWGRDRAVTAPRPQLGLPRSASAPRWSSGPMFAPAISPGLGRWGLPCLPTRAATKTAPRCKEPLTSSTEGMRGMAVGVGSGLWRWGGLPFRVWVAVSCLEVWESGAEHYGVEPCDFGRARMGSICRSIVGDVPGSASLPMRELQNATSRGAPPTTNLLSEILHSLNAGDLLRLVIGAQCQDYKPCRRCALLLSHTWSDLRGASPVGAGPHRREGETSLSARPSDCKKGHTTDRSCGQRSNKPEATPKQEDGRPSRRRLG
ncbi:hypothetical protein GGTG_02159 [Gaeumannomyces tritici R3-111a-1]|uniref:Uncharacterized protein n=1 Tax=Gaeumannomyces tritici (strain R3-111a-1) TaxID=644352 RepID=J3NLL0_GAET3|nr:hypothetical protein GGTG_02159 [Gaeumannomyces tritici R3-111a-1]EJT82185.1 hypothetical protein GGTG_02159 [Gaeumannomyces tritici R3-111a-1]